MVKQGARINPAGPIIDGMTDDDLLTAWKRGELEVIPSDARRRILMAQALDRVTEQHGEALDRLADM